MINKPKRGDIVWLSWIGDRRSNYKGLRECTITSIGSKYVSVKDGYYDVRFEIDNNYRQKTEYGANYRIWFSKTTYEDEKELHFLMYTCKYNNATLQQMREIGKILNIEYVRPAETE